MTLTELSIKRPSFVVVVFAVLTLLGLISYNQLGYELLPKFNVPTLTVTAVYPGAAPTEIESQVTKRIEDAVSALEGIKRIRSTSLENLSVVIIELQSTVDVDAALSDAQRKISRIAATLPTNCKAPSVAKVSSDDFPILRYSLSSSLEPKELFQLVKEQIKPQISSVKGVADVQIIGGEERALRVNVNAERLRAHGLSILAVTQAIGQGNLDFPTGKVENDGQNLSVRLAGKFTTVEALRNLVVAHTPAGSETKLADVAEVIDSRKEVTQINRINGLPAVGLYVLKGSDANAVATAAQLRKKVADIENQYKDKHIKISANVDTTLFTIDAAEAVQHDLMIALLLVSLVILVFLHSIRDSFIVMLAIPCSFVATFIAIYLFGFTLNLMTMLALTLVVGILVDDSIVVLENIHRHLHKGESRREAALNGRNEIGFTATAITFVDVVVFLPLALTNAGVISVILRQFASVVVVSTLLSLFVSFTVTPLLASRFSSVVDLTKPDLWSRFNAAVERGIEGVIAWYTRQLTWVLSHKLITLVAVSVMFVGAIMLAANGFIGSTFVEEGDRGEAFINLELEKTASLETTSRVSAQAEKMLLAMPEVKTVVSAIGGSSSREAANSASPYKSELSVKLVPLAQRTTNTALWVQNAKDRLRTIAGVKVTGSPVDLSGGANVSPIQIIVSGDNPDSVMHYAQSIKTIVQNTPATIDVKLSTEGGIPEVRVDMDKEKMAALGLNVQTVGATMQNAYAGNDDSKYRERGTEYDIVVQLDGFDRRDADAVRHITFMNDKGQLIELGQFATVAPSLGPSQLERTNRISSIKVNAELRGREVGDVAPIIEKKIETMHIPSSIHTTFIGDYDEQKNGFGAIGGAFGLSIILVYLLMVLLYDNYVYPFVVLFAIPVALIGAFLALALAKGSLSIFTMMGMVVLIGLVCKNAILIVDFANKLKLEGYSSRDALIEAGRERLRPIMMTTIAMVLGMLPVATAATAGAAWKNGLGWVLVGGLTSSMCLTVFVVPAIYLIVDNVAARFPRTRRKDAISSAAVATEAVAV